MLGPRYFSRTIGAGLIGAPIEAYGQHILIVSISASTIEMSIQDEPWQRIIGGLHIDCKDRRYSRIIQRNTGGVAGTVELFLSDVWISLEAVGGLLAAIAASLVNIDQEVSGAAVSVQIPNLLLPASPAAGLQILAANGLATEREITAPETNGGFAYLGITAARCTAVDKFFVLYPGGIWWSERFKGAVFGSGNDALENVNARES